MNEFFTSVAIDSHQELRLELHRAKKGSARPSAQVTMRIWTTLSGQPDKVPTGRAVTLGVDALAPVCQSLDRARQALQTDAPPHE